MSLCVYLIHLEFWNKWNKSRGMNLLKALYTTTVGSLYRLHTPRSQKWNNCVSVSGSFYYFVFFLADAQVKGMFYLLYYSLLSCTGPVVGTSFSFPSSPFFQMDRWRERRLQLLACCQQSFSRPACLDLSGLTLGKILWTCWPVGDSLEPTWCCYLVTCCWRGAKVSPNDHKLLFHLVI